jgi:threonylcarbamoyladenosine tRNA methylthiotransferase MtaB
VTGCYAQRAPEEIADLPHVRYVVGNSHKPLVGQLALNALSQEFPTHGRAEVICSSIFVEKELKPSPHTGSGGRTRAVVKIQDGCNANCSFCIIPSVRGRSRSLAMEAVLSEISELVLRGFKEIILSGIHLGTWGRDLNGRDKLAALIRAILDIDGLQRLRLSSIEPLEVSADIIDLVADQPRMAHHLHIPLQSGSARTLRAMRRPYSPEYYADLVNRVRLRISDASIGADVMVGFPGETDDDFMQTYRLIETSPLTYLHVFPFSSRPGTAAADMPNPVPAHVTRFRGRALRDLIARKNEQFRRRFMDSEIDALTLDDGTAISSNFLKVQLPATVAVNDWVRVRVTGLADSGLQAIPV